MADIQKATDPPTQIALLQQENLALREKIKSLEAKVEDLHKRQDADHVTLAEFVSATRTGKWVLGTLFAIGSLAATVTAVALSRGGHP